MKKDKKHLHFTHLAETFIQKQLTVETENILMDLIPPNIWQFQKARKC